MKLSVLIPTHNRPKMFKRALSSILSVMGKYNVEIIVRCDDNSVTKKDISVGHNIHLYHAKKDINGMYKELYEKSTGDYIYYLEDDDYITPYFETAYKEVSNGLELFVGLYNSVNKDTNISQISEYRIKHNTLYIPSDFQLSQMIFKRSLIEPNDFPISYHNENDEILLKTILGRVNKNKVKYSMRYIFNQGIDYNNLSLDEILNPRKIKNV